MPSTVFGRDYTQPSKFDKHISFIEHKISKAVGIISKLRHFLPPNALLNVYYAFIHPHLLYCLLIWGSSFPSYLKKLTVLQNKAIKLIGGGLPKDRATPFYSKLNVLKLSDLFKLEIGKFVHAHFNNKLPFTFSGYFSLTSKVSQENTRSTLSRNICLYIPRFRTNRLQKCIGYQGVKICNDIPAEIQTTLPILFKKRYKKHLIQLYD